MIDVQGLTYRYPNSSRAALTDFSMRLGKGELALVVGESGCGKSTLLYALNGIIPHVFGGKAQGEVRVNGLHPAQTPLRVLSRNVGTVFQNPDNQIFMPRVYDDVAFGCENLGLPPTESRGRAERWLKEMGLGELRNQETHELSGGQKQRLALAGALAMGPEILLLDEPTADLDQQGREEVLAALRALKARGFTVVLVEHQYQPFVELADQVVVIKDGRRVGEDSLPDHTLPRRRPPAPSKEALLRAEGLSFRYDGGRLPVLRDLSFEIAAGEMVALIGPNGSGKTTLFKLSLGLHPPARGSISIGGRVNPDAEALVGEVGYLFQNPDEQLFADTVSEEVEFGPRNLGRPSCGEDWLCQFGLQGYRQAHPLALSRGERQRLALAAVLALRPRLLLLDEPTTGLDSRWWAALMDQVVELNQSGTTVIFSTHNTRVVEAYAGRVISLNAGRIVSDCRLGQ